MVAVAVLTLLAEVAVDGGLLLLVDDAQWVDRPSADAFVFVARRLEAEGSVLVFAARQGAARRFEAAGLPQLVLSGLDPPAVRALLAERAPHAGRSGRRRVGRSHGRGPARAARCCGVPGKHRPGVWPLLTWAV